MSPAGEVSVELEAERARLALLITFILTGLVFPVGVFLTRLVGGDLFAKSQALTSLGLLLALTQSFYWPVVIVVFRQAPDWTPFAMAVLFGSHFLSHAWFYREVTALVAKGRAGAAFAEPTPT